MDGRSIHDLPVASKATPQRTMMESAALAGVVSAAYGREVEATVRMKTVYGFVCADGSRWILKAAPPRETQARLIAVAQVVHHLSQAGVRVAGPVPCRTGPWLVSYGGIRWYLQPWLSGRHLDLSTSSERMEGILQIAAMHAATTELADGSVERLLTAPLVHRLNRKRASLVSVWPHACSQLPALRRHQRMIFEGIEQAIETAREMSTRRDILTFCHRDLAPHNLLYDPHKQPAVSIIDLDHAGIDDPYLDIIQFCNHSLHFTEPDLNLFNDIVSAYAEASRLAVDVGSLRRLLGFPDVLIRSIGEWAQNDFSDQNLRGVKEALTREQWRKALLRRV